MSNIYGSGRDGGAWRLYVGVLVVAFPLLVGLLSILGVGGDDNGPGPSGSVTPGLTSSAPSPTASETSVDPSADASTADPSASVPGTTDPDPSALPSSATSVASPDDPEEQPLPKPSIVTWGGSGTQLAIVIRNDSPWLVRRARVRISAWDSEGELVRRTTGPAGSTCCTVLGLPPGGVYGVFLLLDRGVDDIARVRVRYATLVSQRVRKDTPRIDVSGARLVRTSDDTLVEATFTRLGAIRDAGGFVVGQAFLSDRRGRLVGVISGRFACFSPAAPSGWVSMQLLRSVPPGTRIERVFAYPIPDGVPVRFPHTCDLSSTAEGK